MKPLTLLILIFSINVQATTANINAAAIPDITFNTTSGFNIDIDNCLQDIDDKYINPVTDEMYIEDDHLSQDDYTEMKDVCKSNNR